MIRRARGAKSFTATEATRSVRVKLGAGMESFRSASEKGLFTGQQSPALEITQLGSDKRQAWKPQTNRNTMLLFVSLWRPEAKSRLERARNVSAQRNCELQIVSVDWSQAAAERLARRLGVEKSVVFASPGGLELTEWYLTGPATAVVVTPEGKINAIVSEELR